VSGVTERPHQPVGRNANGRVIVDDRNQWNLRQGTCPS
jgi:hypothetical protein